MILICPACNKPFEPDDITIREAELAEEDEGTTVEDLVCPQCWWNEEMYNTRAWNWR